MALAIFGTMIVLLLLGFPMMIPLIAGSLIGFVTLFQGFGQLDTRVYPEGFAFIAGHRSGAKAFGLRNFNNVGQVIFTRCIVVSDSINEFKENLCVCAYNTAVAKGYGEFLI